MELAETASDDAVPHIIGALSDPSDDVRLQAARVLQEFDGETVAAGLSDALQDSSDTVAAAAADSLAELKSPEAALPLLPLTTHEKPFVRANALRALKGLGILKR